MSIFQKIEDRSAWEDLLSKTFFKTFFHTLEWETFLEREFFWIKFERYIWKNEFLLSIARCRLFGKEKLVSHPLCEYGGPMPLKREADIEGFIGDFQREFGPRAKIKFHPYIQPSNPPEINTAPPTREIVTCWIEDFSKKTPQDLWNNFRKTLKQEIQKGEGLMEVRECQSESELRQFYGIYLRTVKRHKNIPLPFCIFQFLLNGSGAKIFLAKNKNEVVGGSVFLFYPPFIHYFVSASDERLRGANVGHQILWYALQKYVGYRIPHIYDYFDLGGTRKGSALEVFKRGWGTKEYPIYETGPAKAKSNNVFLRGIAGAMPAIIMERIAPLVLWAKM